MTVGDIAKAIEDFAPLQLQESYDNAGLQVGNPDMQVSSVLLCLDVTDEIISEAHQRECNMIVSHHPLIFKGLKHLTGATPTERMVMTALASGIAVYSAHTNLDSAFEGVSYEIANSLGVTDCRPLRPLPGDPRTGLGVTGIVKPTPRLEFLRGIKEIFGVKCLRYSARDPRIVVRRVAICGGSGGSMIEDAIRAGADVYVTGDLRYHDFTSFGGEIILADIGHYESELCSQKIFSRVIRERFPDVATYFAEAESNPIKILL